MIRLHYFYKLPIRSRFISRTARRVVGVLRNPRLHLRLISSRLKTLPSSAAWIPSSTAATSSSVSFSFLKPSPQLSPFFRSKFFDCFLDFSQTHDRKDRFNSSPSFSQPSPCLKSRGDYDESIGLAGIYETSLSPILHLSSPVIKPSGSITARLQVERSRYAESMSRGRERCSRVGIMAGL
jgi:hypothetical protein